MLVINNQNFNDYFWKCRPPIFEFLLIIQHKSADPAFHVRYPCGHYVVFFLNRISILTCEVDDDEMSDNLCDSQLLFRRMVTYVQVKLDQNQVHKYNLWHAELFDMVVY